MSQSEITKTKQGMCYTCKEKVIILNVFKYFRQEHSDLSITEIVRRTAKATGCSEKSVFQFRKQEASSEGLKPPPTTRIRKGVCTNSRDIKYDDSVRRAIRSIINDLKCNDIVPSIKVILRQVKANPELPEFSSMTLRRLIFDMGFVYEKNGNKSVLVEKARKENVKPEQSNKKTKGVIEVTKQELDEQLSENYSVETYHPIEQKFLPVDSMTEQKHSFYAEHSMVFDNPVHSQEVGHWMGQPPPSLVIKYE